MARSPGYRATKHNKKHLEILRNKLSLLRSSQWVQAARIMRDIVHMTNPNGAIISASVQPRACGYCDRFGHTRQHCELRKLYDDCQAQEAARRAMREDARIASGVDVTESIHTRAWRAWCSAPANRAPVPCAVISACSIPTSTITASPGRVVCSPRKAVRY